MHFTLQRLPEESFQILGCSCLASQTLQEKKLSGSHCPTLFASTGIVLVTRAGSSWRDWTPDDWAWEAWWVLPARHLYIKQEKRRAQWPRVASECSHWIRWRMTHHHHPLRFVTRGGVSLFLKVLKSDQCTESNWEWTLFRQIAEHHSIWAFENIFTTDYTFGLLRC